MRATACAGTTYGRATYGPNVLEGAQRTGLTQRAGCASNGRMTHKPWTIYTTTYDDGRVCFNVQETDGRRWEFRWDRQRTLRVWACDDDGTPIAETDVLGFDVPTHVRATETIDWYLELVAENV